MVQELLHAGTVTALDEEDLALHATFDRLNDLPGASIAARADVLAHWRNVRLQRRVWHWGRYFEAPLGPRLTLRDETGIATHGLNFATADPLSLASHPALAEAAIEAVRRYGLHGPGSPCLAGTTPASIRLEAAVADLLGIEHVVLFPSGWAAAYGVTRALLQSGDHVVIDAEAHPALLDAATASLPRVHRYPHLDVTAAVESLRTIRREDARGAILVATDTLFPWDSDTPDLAQLATACRAYNATLLPAVGHDLGTMGLGGMGILGNLAVLAEVDVVVGSFAKSFASNGGFFATRSAALKQWVRLVASTHASSNALAPHQAAIATEAIRIVRSPEGTHLRANLERAISAVRSAASERGLRHLGIPSAIVPIAVATARTARLAEMLAAERGVLVNAIERPLIRAGDARLVLHIMAAHRPEHAREAIDALASSLASLDGRTTPAS